MHIQFASGPQRLPFSSANLSLSAGGTTTSRTLYFALQGENPSGLNLLSAIVGPLTIAAGQKLTLTLPDIPALNGAVGWTGYVLSASLTSDPTTFQQIAKINRYDATGMPRPFPLTLTLTSDAQFLLGQFVTDLATVANPISGMMRGLGAAIFEYDPDCLLPVSPPQIMGAPIGRWIRKSIQFETYIALTRNPGGCDQALQDIAAGSIAAPRYRCDGSIPPPANRRTFWLQNDSSASIPAGLRVGLLVTQDQENKSQLFEGFLRCEFMGYAIAGGLMRITDPESNEFPGLGQANPFTNRKSDLLLPDDLQPGESYALRVYPQFLAEEFVANADALELGIPDLAQIKIAPFLYSQAGAYDPSGKIFGNWILPEHDRGVTVPWAGASVRVLKRSGKVNSREFSDISPTVVTGFLPNTDRQKIALNSEGAVYRRPEDLQSYEALRCLVSTKAGIGAFSGWSAPITLLDSGYGLTVTCTYPTTANGLAIVRPDYPDPLIRGSAKAKLNAPSVVIYLRSGGQIRRFEGFMVIDDGTPTQQFAIQDWSLGVIVDLPAPDADFGLFRAVSIAAIADRSGTLPMNSYEVGFAFDYRDGSAITSISHSPILGCIHTPNLTIAQMELAAQAWAPPVETLDQLRALPLVEVSPHQTRYVYRVNDPYRFDPYSYGVDTGSTLSRVVRLSQTLPTEPGRFIQDDSTTWFSGDVAPAPEIGEVGSYYFRSDGYLYEKTSPTEWERGLKVASSIWYSGSGAPAPTLGGLNDYYLDELNGVYYRKNTATAWTLRSSWRIDWITQGRDPLNADGKVLDFFLNLNTGELFRKTSPTTWSSRANLKGAAGDRGSKFIVGLGPPSNAQGQNDDFYVDRLNGDGYVKTDGDWGIPTMNLRGPSGDGGSGGGTGGGSLSSTGITLSQPYGTPSAPIGDIVIWHRIADGNSSVAMTDDQGVIHPFAFRDMQQTWTKAQRSETVYLPNYSYEPSVTTIDANASNLFCIRLLGEGAVTIEVDNHNADGTNFLALILVGGSETLPSSVTFGSSFEGAFLPGQTPQPDVTRQGRYHLSCTRFGQNGFNCQFTEV